MLKRILNIFLLTSAMLSVIIVLISPNLLFTSGKLRTVRLSFSQQKVAPKRLFINSWRTIKILYVDETMNHQDWNKWKKRYLKQIKTNDDVVVAVNTMLASLNDKNSEFFNRTDFQLQSNYIKDNSDSINFDFIKKENKEATKILLTTIAGAISKAVVIKNSKTYKDPKENDEIIRIDGYPLYGMEMNKAIKLIQGKNAVQKVDLLRNGKLITRTVLRGSMEIDKMSSRILPDSNIMVINMFSLMGENAISDFQNIINSSHNCKGIIIDLRGNIGGLFPNAIGLADIFIDNGNITTIKYRNNFKIEVNAQIPSNLPKKPIVILVDKRTASASEIFAGALKYNNKAIIIGTNTYGKNSVQQIVPLHNEMGMNITIARYLLNGNKDINVKGIEPDYTVHLTANDIVKNNDKQMKKAIEIINKEAIKINSNQNNQKPNPNTKS